MEEYKPNSHKSKETQEAIAEKKVEKVVTGAVKVKKKNGFEKLAGTFVPDDVDNVKSYIMQDIIVPAIKDVILDAVRAFLGVNGRSGDDRRPTASRISYKDYYGRKDDRPTANTPRNRSGYDYEDYVITNRGEAEDVLSRMDEMISVYGMVSVADLYDLIGVTGNYTDNKYGWTDIRSASVVRVRDGYIVKMPKAMPLD